MLNPAIQSCRFIVLLWRRSSFLEWNLTVQSGRSFLHMAQRTWMTSRRQIFRNWSCICRIMLPAIWSCTLPCSFWCDPLRCFLHQILRGCDIRVISILVSKHSAILIKLAKNIRNLTGTLIRFCVGIQLALLRWCCSLTWSKTEFFISSRLLLLFSRPAVFNGLS